MNKLSSEVKEKEAMAKKTKKIKLKEGDIIIKYSRTRM